MAPTLEELEGELKRDPRSRRFLDLAREYLRLGRLDDSLVLCESGLEANPSQWQARILLAQLYMAKARMEEAKAQVERVLLPLPDNVSANHLAADIYSTLGDGSRALRHYQIVELLEPGRPGVRERILELTRPAEADAAPVRFDVPASGPSPAEEAADDRPLSGEVPAEPPKPAAEELSQPEQPAAEPPVLAAEPEEFSGEPDWTADTANFDQSVLEEESLPDLYLEVSPSTESDAADAAVPSEEYPALESQPMETTGEPAEEESEPAFQEDGGLPQAAPPQTGGGTEMEDTGGLNTLTLAQLYEKQGYPEKAVEIYQRVLLKDPDNPEVRDKISGLIHRMAGEEPDMPAVRQEDVEKALRMKRVTTLQDWLRRVREGSYV